MSDLLRAERDSNRAASCRKRRGGGVIASSPTRPIRSDSEVGRTSRRKGQRRPYGVRDQPARDPSVRRHQRLAEIVAKVVLLLMRVYGEEVLRHARQLLQGIQGSKLWPRLRVD